MGKGGGSSPSPPAASKYEKALAKIAEQTFAETTPLRQSLISQAEQFTGGGYDPTQNPMYAPLYSTARAGLEDQYGVAKENILSSTPQGGALTSALSNLERGRASDVGMLPATITPGLVQDLTNRAYGMATGAPGQAMSGLGAVAGTYGARASSMYGADMAMQAQIQASQNEALSKLGGSLGAALILK